MTRDITSSDSVWTLRTEVARLAAENKALKSALYGRRVLGGWQPHTSEAGDPPTGGGGGFEPARGEQ